MKAARDYNPQSKNWRVRYIDEKTGLMRSGSGRNAALLFEVHGQHWETMAFYYPKFCPECGRKLESYGRG